MLWYRDNKLAISFDIIPEVQIYYPTPFMDKDEKKEVIEVPFKNLKELFVTIEYYSNMYQFIIKKDFSWNGANIPVILQFIFGASTNPKYLIPSMIHDILCINKNLIDRNRKLSSKVLEALLIVSGVNKWIAKLFYFFVDLYQRFRNW